MLLRVIGAARRGNHGPWRMTRTVTRPLSSRAVIDMATRDGELRVFLVAGEVSGDSIASRLMASLKKLSPYPVRFAGVGGDLMRREGLQRIFPMEDLAVMGLWELLPHIINFRARLKETVEAAVSFRPQVVVTVDSKGFSFRLLKQLNDVFRGEKDRPVHVHYVAPSFWAWKGGERRLERLRQFVDHILCILPFEAEVCRWNGLAATYVGHPVLEDALHLDLDLDPSSNKQKMRRNGDAFRHEHGLSPGATVITLLPGSRLQEVTRMLPIYLQAVQLLKDSFADLSIIIPVAPNRDVEAYINREVQSWSLSAVLISGASLDKKYNAFSASSAALCTSGTGVMELQLAGLSCVVAYQAHFLTEWLIQYKTKLNFISLPNIILNSAVIPEVLFRACTSEKLATILSRVVADDSVRDQQASAAQKVLELLRPPSESISSSVLRESGLSSAICCPSMIAASKTLDAELRRLDQS
ncbi:probable lipid-A-disaccharide synthase, mitochondrial isoform X2 [Phoenix dactylifera]|uniref:lipid-A-disaccharide synthase n=1 Tax=Phoenix dactylifera TaxID=42345 RepID=A0A8B7BYN4_PHODC|nr:probable lipid-A-disaccharide synthase, mitochondrial isoform X2 [Phoenix dactylifera]